MRRRLLSAAVNQKAVFLTAYEPSARVADGRCIQRLRRFVSGTPVRSFRWWFVIGALLTLSVLMVQGGVRELFDGTPPGSGASAYISFGSTSVGEGLWAVCVALVISGLS